jgi:quercetin dioxygenase-like cupin family protein
VSARESYPWGGIVWFASRAVGGAEELTLGLTTILPGLANPLHRHPNCEEALYVLRGEIDQVIEGRATARLKAGDAVLIPRNLKHRCLSAGPEPAELVIAFSSADRQTVLEPEP